MKPETQSFYEVAVERAVEQVTLGLDRAIDLQVLARRAALSPFHFHRVFRGMLGETPLELHRRLRMERAAWQLLHEDTSVTVIAFAAGYETYESLDVEIKTMPELRVATLTHLGPYNRIGETFARLDEIARSAGLIGPEAAILAIYHDDPETTPASELRSEAALVASPNLRLPSELGERRLPGGRYACTNHLGPYEKLGDTWARFMGEWLPRSGHRMSDGVSYEIYRNTRQPCRKTS